MTHKNFCSKIFSDLMESNIQFGRWLVYEEYLCLISKWQGKWLLVNSTISFEVVGVCLFVYCNGACESGLSSPKHQNQMRHFNLTQWEFNAGFSPWILSVFIVQFTVRMAKLNRLAKAYRKRICSRTENFAHCFATRKLFERIQILNEWKSHPFIQ